MKKKYSTICLLLALVLLAASCKTGKGCDCPTFGQTETPKQTHF